MEKKLVRSKIHKTFPIIVFLFAFLQFINTIGHDFAWDDKIVIQENERVQKGITGIPDLFLKYNSEERQDKYGYRPITLTTFAIEYSLFEGNPKGFHFMNVLYFAILCLILFKVLKRLFQGYNLLLPFLITMLFAAHPLHVEVVANIKSRDELLALLFCLLSLYQFLEFYSKQKWKHLIFSSLLFLLAFLSKENAIAFLAVYPLAVLIQGTINWRRFLKSSFILPILGVLALGILYYAFNSNLGVEKTSGLGVYEESHILGNSFYNDGRIGVKIANAFQLILLYLKNFFAPYPLTYYSDTLPILGLHWKIILSCLVTLFLLIFSVAKFKKHPIIAFGILFFFITLSVYLHVFRTFSDAMADRFMFIPSLGLCIALVGALGYFFKIPFKEEQKEEKQPESVMKKFSALPMAFKGLFLVFIISMSILTFSRNKVWKDDFTLVSTDMVHLENAARPHYYYASLLNQKMLNEGWSQSIEDEMILHYTRSMELSDEMYYGRLELGTYFCNKERLLEGIPVLEEMIILFPEASDPRHFLGQAYFQIEEYEKSIIQLEKSVELGPNNYDSHHLLSMAYAMVGRFDEAVLMAQDGIARFSGSEVSFYQALGLIYYEKKDFDKSTEYTLKMIEFGSSAHDSYATVIGRYQSQNDLEKASFYYQQAIERGIMQP
ncbi:MAG: tetratricopeptide repeat protein [Crocinitomicaceae bacterium]|nr:tetratricopeptide repeat protein [Crocinitomicaceae bacterium]